ncbi:hypothetical protein LZ30DRAFT_777070 [Colletotrichum cereale]|nr:hypothetical protein LZ30DRAFT_777070 [Colletotrichum cereale]
MCAISNGLAAFKKGTFLTVTSSFFIFYLYAAPAVRLAAIGTVAGAFIGAIGATRTPTIMSLSRPALTQYTQHSPRDGVAKGAYVFVEADDFDATLTGVGSVMGFTMEARALLLLEEEGINSRVVSFPCQRLFEQQSDEHYEG